MDLTRTAADAAEAAAQAAEARRRQHEQARLVSDRNQLIGLMQSVLGITVVESQLVTNRIQVGRSGLHAVIIDGLALALTTEGVLDDQPVTLKLTIVHADGTFSTVTTNETNTFRGENTTPITSTADLGRRLAAKSIKAHVQVTGATGDGFKYGQYTPGVGFPEGFELLHPLRNPLADQVRVLLDSIGPGLAEAVAGMVVDHGDADEVLAPLVPIARQIIAEAG